MSGLKTSLMAFTLILVASCGSVVTNASDPALSPEQAAAQYRLGAGDKLHVTVFGQPDMSGDFTVDSAGSVPVPLVGAVQAGGKTTAEFQEALQDALRGTYLANPSVSVEITEFRPFYILGEVNKPGAYPSTAGMTVTQAVATAQGFTYRANTHRVYIRHSGDRSEKAYALTGATLVTPGDTIRVPERFF